MKNFHNQGNSRRPSNSCRSYSCSPFGDFTPSLYFRGLDGWDERAKLIERNIYTFTSDTIVALLELVYITRQSSRPREPSIHSQCGRPDQTLRFSDLTSLPLSHGNAQPRGWVCTMCVAITTTILSLKSKNNYELKVNLVCDYLGFNQVSNHWFSNTKC